MQLLFKRITLCERGSIKILFSELTNLGNSYWDLNIEYENFFNQDYIVKNEVRASTEDSAALVRIENILTNAIDLLRKWFFNHLDFIRDLINQSLYLLKF